LRARGDEVVVTYAHDEAAAEAARQKGFTASRCDVAVAAEVDAFCASAGDFDVFVHSAGFTRDKLMMMMPESDFDAVTNVHLKGAFLTGRRVVKGMIAKKWGRIVLVVSPTALRGRPGQTNYGAAKAGLIGLCRSLAHEMARFRVTVNCVSAGLVETEITAALSEKVRQELLAAVPLGRMGRAEEVAAAVGWLCSDAASYVTGQVLGVDGGLS
jgi:3-oxoacyl-[acyl-carrier protein] reductase